MLELDTITIRGFKSISSVEKLKLGTINIVIGPNGSGKSNFVSVFSFLHAIREGHLQEYVLKNGGADKILHFGSKITENIYIHISFQNGKNEYEITLQPSVSDEMIPHWEAVRYWNKSHPKPYEENIHSFGKEAGISKVNTSKIANYVKDRLSRWKLYHFHDTSPNSPIKKIADVNDNRYLRPDASNLASYLYFLSQEELDSYELISKTVQRVAPFFDYFILEPLKLNPKKIQMEWRHKGSDAYFDVSSLSDGTLRFIALATLFLQPEEYRPSVILIDEPELGLHPFAIAMLASLIKQASKKTQVIVSTQSSLLLDHFELEDVLITNRANGSTQFSRLDPKNYEEWLKDYSLGQLWEKNEIGGRPTIE
ncbi:MAG: AAA family ATPase [Leptospiraceae bacterium]|nr:AAA family ATPase [Leptospiraceae bacterium]MCP5493635.1 AAA family ATPase [Leptospiraceae bacterium]